MSSTENRQNSFSEGLDIPGLVQSQESVEQLSFAANPFTPLPTSSLQAAGPQSSPALDDLETMRQPVAHASVSNPGTPLPALDELPTTRQSAVRTQVADPHPSTPLPLSEPGSTRALLLQSQPEVTHALTRMLSQPGVVSQPVSETGSPRQALVIRGDSQKNKVLARPPQGRRHVIGIAAMLVLLFIVGGSMLAVSPLDHDRGFNFNPLTWGSNLFNNPNNTSYNLQVQATATAVYHQRVDGFDPGTSQGSGPVVTGSPHPWPVGVCTYWANARYHTLTGNWVTWTGNAYQWAQGARLAGWNVSSQPHVPSIIVLQAGVQGASGFGHVAVVESINADGSAHTSNMNFYANGGGFDRVSYYDFRPGSGVSFIWK